MLRFLLGFLLIGAAAPAAAAADWWYVGDGGSGDSRHIAYVDRSSLAKDGKHVVRAWTLAVLATPRENGETHSRTLRRFDCKGKTWALLTTISYDASEGVLQSDYAESAPMPVAPGTV